MSSRPVVVLPVMNVDLNDTTGLAGVGRPEVVPRREWERARRDLLRDEKALTRARDAVAARRRRLPMVKIEKGYQFDGVGGTVGLVDLFHGRRQLIIRHFMYHPEWDEGCVGCSLQVDNLGHPAHLNARDTTLVLVARAPLPKLLAFRRRMGWQVDCYSSAPSDFNVDFGVTTSEGEERAGLSVFLQHEGRVLHTYSTFSRGGDALINTYNYLDLTPLGRQEKHLPHPQAWWRHHDRYGDLPAPAPEVTRA